MLYPRWTKLPVLPNFCYSFAVVSALQYLIRWENRVVENFRKVKVPIWE